MENVEVWKKLWKGYFEVFLGDWKISFTLIIAHSQYKPISYLKQKKIPCLIISSNSLIMLILKYMQRALWLWSIGNLFCVSKAHGFDGCDRDSAKQMPATYMMYCFLLLQLSLKWNYSGRKKWEKVLRSSSQKNRKTKVGIFNITQNNTNYCTI